MAADHPEMGEYCRALAKTRSELGSLRFRTGQPEQARASLEQALAIWLQLTQRSGRVPEDRDGLAGVQQRLGYIYGQKGRSAQAEAMLKEAASTYQALVADYPDAPEYRQSFARTCGALGAVYHNNLQQADKAEAAHQQARQIYEGLAREHPDMWEYAFQLGRCYRDLALDSQLSGRSDATLTYSDKAIEILEQVVRSGHGQVRADLFDVWLYRASLLAERGDHARAASEASSIARQEGLGIANDYNIACVFAQSSTAAGADSKLAPPERTRLKELYADRAMEFLRRAVTKGFQNPANLKNDQDLAPLRSREDFQKLAREVEEKSKQ